MAVQKEKQWVVAGSQAAIEALETLIEARKKQQPVTILQDAVTRLFTDPAGILPENCEAVLVVGPSCSSPRKMLPGLYLHDAAKRKIPVGWLPERSASLKVYARSAAKALRRDSSPGPVVVLGQWEKRFLKMARRTASWLQNNIPNRSVFNWTADRLSGSDMVAGLSYGPGIAIYYGHGRSRGWAGYHGIRAGHFVDPWPEPVGSFLFLCCEAASRADTDLSFAEDLALRGVFCGGLAAVSKTKAVTNHKLGTALCKAMKNNGTGTLAELLAAAELPNGFLARTPYRFIGDPAAPVTGSADAELRSGKVFAPAPDEELPPWPE